LPNDPESAYSEGMKKPQRIVRKASFPRLSELREELGWEVIDILRKLTSDKPSIATIYRLDRGQAVRVASARKVFAVVNAALGNTLDASKELVIDPPKKR
jgi:hypothetical protein